MPLLSSIVGEKAAEHRYTVDARWLMAYAAGVLDASPCFSDTSEAIAMHPVFPVCLEWDSILALRNGPGSVGLTAAEKVRALHAEHDLHLFRSINPDVSLTTQATAIGLESRSPGAFLTTRIDTRDARGELICRTYQGNLFRGVGVSGPERHEETSPSLPRLPSAQDLSERTSVRIPVTAAHIYTECARIWNPIHTDKAFAIAAGLPGIILHGTATLAYTISALIARWVPGGPGTVYRLGGRFSGMVRLPDTLTVESGTTDSGTIAFRVLNAEGLEVIRRGFLCFRDN